MTTVWPKNEAVRAVLRHTNGIGFASTGSASWPDDPFTRRRIRDGDVVLTETQGTIDEPGQLHLNHEIARPTRAPTVVKTGA